MQEGTAAVGLTVRRHAHSRALGWPAPAPLQRGGLRPSAVGTAGTRQMPPRALAAAAHATVGAALLRSWRELALGRRRLGRGRRAAPAKGFRVERTEEEWRALLGRREFNALRQHGTEPPLAHEYSMFMPSEGYFACGACGLPLYPAGAKFESQTGWPSFNRCYYSDVAGGCHVGARPDFGAHEIYCRRCDSHLGHVFNDGRAANGARCERH